MGLLPDVQPVLDPHAESENCILCLSESEFLAMIDNLVSAMRRVPEGAKP
ncbi:MAG: hypothetical protein ACYC3S_07645 [Chloroflexota bacterium]